MNKKKLGNGIVACLLAVVTVCSSVWGGGVRTEAAEPVEDKLKIQTVTASKPSEDPDIQPKKLIDGKCTNDIGGVTLPDADGLAYFEATLQEASLMNQIKIYLYEYVAKERPMDLAFDVYTAAGEWQRVAELHKYEWQIISEKENGQASVNELTINFGEVTATKFRVTANFQRNAELVESEGYPGTFNLRIVELEAYHVSPSGKLTGVVEDNNKAYNIPLPVAFDTITWNEGLDTHPVDKAMDGNKDLANDQDSSHSAVALFGSDYLGYFQLSSGTARELNSVLLTFSQHEPEYRPKDIAIDVLENGTWKRVAEKHDIVYETGLFELRFKFAPVNATAVRVTGNQRRNCEKWINENGDLDMNNFRMLEMECFNDSRITEQDYTGTDEDENNKAYNIPLPVAFDRITWNEGLDTHPVDKAMDGKKDYAYDHEAEFNSAVASFESDYLGYFQLSSSTATAQELNSVLLTFSQHETERRPKDIAIDVRLADGTWKRVAEKHNIAYLKTNIFELEFKFETVSATAVRVTGNQRRNWEKWSKESTESRYDNFRMLEIECFKYSNINTSECTGTEKDQNGAYNIPVPDAVDEVNITGVTASSTGTDLEKLYDKTTIMTDKGGFVPRDASDKAYVEATLEGPAKMNQIKMYLHMYEADKRPVDLVFAVKTTGNDTTWQDVAALRNIDWEIQTDGSSNKNLLEINFDAVTNVTAFRVTADFKRGGSELRIVELEAYHNQTLTANDYTGMQVDNAVQSVEIGEVRASKPTRNDFDAPGLLINNNFDEVGGVSLKARDGFAYFEAVLKEKATMNQIKMHLYKYVADERPHDLAFDVCTSAGRWVRVAELHNIEWTTHLDNNDNPAADQNLLEINFQAVEATAFRVTANFNGGGENLRIVELEAYNNTTLTSANYTQSDTANDTNRIPSPTAVQAANLTLTDNIGVNFYLKLGPADLPEDVRMEFTPANRDTQKSSGVYDPKTDCYKYSCEVTAKEMTSDINVKVYVGEDLIKEDTYSVKKYADTILGDTTKTYEKAVPLVTAMLNYGTCAQGYFAYNTDALAYAGLEKEDRSVSSVTADNLEKYKEYTQSANPNIATLAGASLILDSETTLKLYFELPNGADVKDYTFLEGEKELEPKKNKGYYSVSISKITAKDLNQPHTVEVVCNGEKTSVTYNPMTYCYKVLTNYSGKKKIGLQNVVRALYLYNQKANEYSPSSNAQ